MPTYDYICEGCKVEFEQFQSITAKPLRKCPHCGKKRLVRLIGSGAGIIFKGSGFYETDYRSESYKKAAKSEKSFCEKNKGTGKKKDKPKDKQTKSSEKAKSGTQNKKKPA